MTHAIHKFWMKVAAVVVGSFGPVFFFGSMLDTSEFARWSLDVLDWPIDGEQSFADPTTRFLSALTGGFLFGWGVMIWCLSGKLYDAEPELVRKAVLTGLIAWFLLDSAGSVTAGAASNVFFNVLVLVTAVGPLCRPAKS